MAYPTGTGAESHDSRRLAIIIVAITVVVLVLRFWPAFTIIDGIELQTLDRRLAHRGPQPPDPRIVIVHVDESSILEVGRWPWPRREFARLIRLLDGAGAEAIVFDIFFADPDRAPGGDRSDRDLVTATEEVGSVYHAAFGHAPRPDSGDGAAGLAERAWDAARVLEPTGLNAVAELFEVGEVTPPLPGLVRAARDVGFVNVVDSGDGIYRHTFPLVTHGEHLYPSLSVAVAADLLEVEPEQVVVRPGESIDLGGRRRIPIDRMGRMLIDFAGGSGTYPYVTAHDVLAMGENSSARARFEDTIVFVAVTAPGLYDLRASPFDAVYYGVETQANAVANILAGRFLRHAPGESTALIVVVLAAVIYLGMSRLRPTRAVIFAAFMLLAYNWIVLQLFQRGLVVEMVAPNLVLILGTGAGLALRLVGEESESARARKALSRFVPAAVIDRVVAEHPEELLRGHRREVTVLFADIRNFTASSEALSPEQTVELLNRFFHLVHEIIWELDGTLDKYLGDGLMAFWNSPLDQPDHAQRAVQAAIDIQRRISYNQAEWEYLGMPELEAGIGISTGQAVVGYVGTGERMQYTAIGAHVNLAARLETMTKEFDCPILISAATREQIGATVEARSLGPVEVRGFSEPVEVYEVTELKDG
ncbi:MAG: CHASE2 domain-containing protein [Armatimonadota bacterium]|jgi:adenylate cyclase